MATTTNKTLSYTLTLVTLLSLLFLTTHLSHASPSSHFEGFGDEEDTEEDPSIHLTDLPPSLPLTQSNPPPASQSQSQSPPSDQSPPSIPKPSSSHSHLDYWDEDEFEGLPIPETTPTVITPPATEEAAASAAAEEEEVIVVKPKTKGELLRKFAVEIACGSFLIVFAINYFTGKKENENLALAWASKFATKDSIFDKNFSLLGVGEGDDSPLLLKEGQNVFKFYASGRRYCQGLLATMELKSRHDLISRIYNAVVPTKDEISFEVYMNDDSMDQVVFAVAKKKLAKQMLKELPDLQRFAGLMPVPGNRKWVAEELAVVSESKEVAGDLITEAVLDQVERGSHKGTKWVILETVSRSREIGVFGDKAFEKLGKLFISMHFSDQQPGIQKKKLMFKFALPDANQMADMTRLVALVPYYIDLVGRYKLSSQARSKTDAVRVKIAQEAYKEMQNVRQEAMQRKKFERKKLAEEAEAKLSAEAIRKREAKERARQIKKAMPKIKMSRS